MLILSRRSSCREGFKKLDILTVPCLYIIMPWCYLLLKILIFIKLTPLFLVWIQGSKINCTHPQRDLPQYREVFTIHLLKYSTSYHKIYSNFVTIYIPIVLLLKMPFIPFRNFFQLVITMVTWTYTFNLYYFVIHIVALNYCVFVIFSL